MTPKDAFGRVAETITCADCNADRMLVEVESGLLIMQIYHDDTCPWIAARPTLTERRAQ